MSFAGDAVGLKGQIKSDELRDRLKRLYDGQDDRDLFTRDNGWWFRICKESRVLSEAESQSGRPRSFSLSTHFKFRVQHSHSMHMPLGFAEKGSWETWEKDGTIVAKKLARYLEDEMDSIGAEFNMYRHHYAPDPSWHTSMVF
jgi:hypothetical protein